MAEVTVEVAAEADLESGHFGFCTAVPRWLNNQSHCCCHSVAQSCPILCDAMDCSTPGFLSITDSRSLLKLTSIKSVMPPNHLIHCPSLLLLPSIFPSIRVFSNEWVLCIRWSKYWSFSYSIIFLLMNIQGWFPWGLTGLISLQSKGLSRVFSGEIIKLMKLTYILQKRHSNFLLSSSIKSHYKCTSCTFFVTRSTKPRLHNCGDSKTGERFCLL